MDPLERRFRLAAGTAALLGLAFGGGGVAALHDLSTAGSDPMLTLLRSVVALLTFGPGTLYLAAAVGLFRHRRGAIYVGLVTALLNGAHGAVMLSPRFGLDRGGEIVVLAAWVLIVGLLLWQLIGLLSRLPTSPSSVRGFDVLPLTKPVADDWQ